MDSDVEALQEGLERIRELLASPSSDMNHDLLNLIGAIRGYAEMLYEDIEGHDLKFKGFIDLIVKNARWQVSHT